MRSADDIIAEVRDHIARLTPEQAQWLRHFAMLWSRIGEAFAEPSPPPAASLPAQTNRAGRRKASSRKHAKD